MGRAHAVRYRIEGVYHNCLCRLSPEICDSWDRMRRDTVVLSGLTLVNRVRRRILNKLFVWENK